MQSKAETFFLFDNQALNQLDNWLDSFFKLYIVDSPFQSYQIPAVHNFLATPPYEVFHMDITLNVNQTGIDSSRFASRMKYLVNRCERVRAMQTLRQVRSNANIPGFVYSRDDIYLESDLLLAREAVQNILVTLGLSFSFFFILK